MMESGFLDRAFPAARASFAGRQRSVGDAMASSPIGETHVGGAWIFIKRQTSALRGAGGALKFALSGRLSPNLWTSLI
jgi:hypothetical protein